MASALHDLARGRCPRCRIGRIFDGRAFPRYPAIARVHPRCVICGIKFDREPGYFLGAMYFSYAIVVIIILITLLILSIFTSWGWKLRFGVALTAIVLLTPPIVT